MANASARPAAALGRRYSCRLPRQPKGILSRKTNTAHSIAFSSDGSQVAVGNDNGTIHLYKIDDKYNPQRDKQITKAHNGPIYGLAFAADSQELISAGEDGKMIVWNVKTGKEVRHYETPRGAITCLAISGDGKFVAAGVKDGKIRVWPVAEPKLEPRHFGGNRRGSRRRLFAGWQIACRLW